MTIALAQSSVSEMPGTLSETGLTRVLDELAHLARELL